MLNLSEFTVLEKTDISFLSNYQLLITTCLGEKLHAPHSLCGGIGMVWAWAGCEYAIICAVNSYVHMPWCI